jgi:hypothetical protein
MNELQKWLARSVTVILAWVMSWAGLWALHHEREPLSEIFAVICGLVVVMSVWLCWESGR